MARVSLPSKQQNGSWGCLRRLRALHVCVRPVQCVDFGLDLPDLLRIRRSSVTSHYIMCTGAALRHPVVRLAAMLLWHQIDLLGQLVCSVCSELLDTSAAVACYSRHIATKQAG